MYNIPVLMLNFASKTGPPPFLATQTFQTHNSQFFILKSQGKEKEKGKKGKKGQTKTGPGSEPRTKRPPPTKKKEENPDAEGLVLFFVFQYAGCLM